MLLTSFSKILPLLNFVLREQVSINFKQFKRIFQYWFTFKLYINFRSNSLQVKNCFFFITRLFFILFFLIWQAIVVKISVICQISLLELHGHAYSTYRVRARFIRPHPTTKSLGGFESLYVSSFRFPQNCMQLLWNLPHS